MSSTITTTKMSSAITTTKTERSCKTNNIMNHKVKIIVWRFLDLLSFDLVGFEGDGFGDGTLDAFLHRFVTRKLQCLFACRRLSGHVTGLVNTFFQFAQKLRRPLGALTNETFPFDESRPLDQWQSVLFVLAAFQQLHRCTTVYFRVGDRDSPFCLENDRLFELLWWREEQVQRLELVWLMDEESVGMVEVTSIVFKGRLSVSTNGVDLSDVFVMNG